MGELDQFGTPAGPGPSGGARTRSTEGTGFNPGPGFTTWWEMGIHAWQDLHTYTGRFCETILLPDDPRVRIGFSAGPFGVFAAEFILSGAEYTQSVLHPAAGPITQRSGTVPLEGLTSRWEPAWGGRASRYGARVVRHMAVLPPSVRDHVLDDVGDPELLLTTFHRSGGAGTRRPRLCRDELYVLAMTHARAVVLRAHREGEGSGASDRAMARTPWEVSQWSIPLGPPKVVRASPDRPPFTPQWPAGLPAPPDPADPGPGQVRERRRWRLLGR